MELVAADIENEEKQESLYFKKYKKEETFIGLKVVLFFNLFTQLCNDYSS
jgi:hypothetical protein